MKEICTESICLAVDLVCPKTIAENFLKSLYFKLGWKDFFFLKTEKISQCNNGKLFDSFLMYFL